MAELKTKQTNKSVAAFIKGISDPDRRKDCETVAALMKNVTKSEPKMWGESIVGFGVYHYKYASGQEGDWPLVGFSPRKQNLTLYLMSGFDTPLVKKLGKIKTGKSCLYINKLSDVDLSVLRQMVKESVAATRKRYA